MLNAHPIADIFPLLEGQAFKDLCEDIAAHGQHEPIWLLDGMILDGRNRYRACVALGIEPMVRTFDAQRDPLQFVLSLNLHRRHLDESQRAMVAARVAILPHGVKKPREDAQICASSVSQPDAAQMLNVSRRAVQHARKVLDAGSDALTDAVQRGALSVSLASQVTQLPEDAFDAVTNAAPQDMAEVARAATKAHVAHNSGNSEWYTPAELITLAREVMGDIDCDPATSAVANETVKAKTYYTAQTDGLTKPWHGRVWMNPPYAQPLIRDFCSAATAKFEQGEISQAIVLVNNATETAWFQQLLTTSTAVCFLRGRVKFVDPQGNPNGAPLQGQAIVYLGDKRHAFAHVFGRQGCVVSKFDEA